MYIEQQTLDDLIRAVFKDLVTSSIRINPTRGPARELTGILLELINPRARLSRTETKGTVFSCLGELLWYLAYSDDREFIRYYISHYENLYDKGECVTGAYGPRLRCMNGYDQIENVTQILKKTDSRKAVIQLFEAADITKGSKDVPCTCTLQFMRRNGKLHMLTSMRSNDAFIGLPHDIFAFTMIQEIFARVAELDLGTYKHVVGSLHLYENDVGKAEQYLNEGIQATTQMPEMPLGDPWSQVKMVLKAEQEIRVHNGAHKLDQGLDPYWADLVRLLQVYSEKDKTIIDEIKSEMHSDIYTPFIERRAERNLQK